MPYPSLYLSAASTSRTGPVPNARPIGPRTATPPSPVLTGPGNGRGDLRAEIDRLGHDENPRIATTRKG